MKRMVTATGALVLGLLLGACDESTAPGGDATLPDGGLTDGVGGGDGPGDGPADTLPGETLPPDGGPCPLGETQCVDTTHQQVCKATGWVTESCPAGTLCLDSACSANCVDECNLDETRTVGGKTETCKLFSVAKNQTVSLSNGLHDRARLYNAWLRKWHLPGGTVGDTSFTNTTYAQVAGYHGTGDSAIWTGSYLAAEALRLKHTGSKDAEKNVETMVEAIHRLFLVTGHPGFMARFTAPLAGDPKVAAIYNPADPSHHKVTYQGQDWFWNGNTSRDQYQGVLLGYALAYEALSSAQHKQMIREDMVALCTELIKERKGVTITVNGLPVQVDMQYVVLNPTEFQNGGPWVQVGSSSNPSDYEASEMGGMREFFPDYATLLKQIPIIGSLIVFPIPRSGSAIMLASILRIGMLVTKGEAAYATTYNQIKQHYDQKKMDWLGIMKLYVFLNASQCWKSYYGLNIVFQPVYNLVRMEDDPALQASYQKDVLEGLMWPYVVDHKNVFFSYIHASQSPSQSSATIQAVVSDANAQLAQFPAPPHAHVAVDNTASYPADPSCPGHASVAVDVKDRVASDFIWQRDPFGLTTAGNPTLVYPGVDYLLAYWMSQVHGFLTDDAAGTCLRWSP
jgi:hypothetical protein